MSETKKWVRDVLLHFTSLKSAALILHEYSLKPSDFARSNDIYENMKRLHAQPFIIETSPDQNYHGHSAKKSELIGSAANIRFLSFCKAKANLDSNETILYVENKELAFRKMWGQYADKFGGACLIFDKERLLETTTALTSSSENAMTEFDGFEVVYQPRDVSIRTLRQLEKLSEFRPLRNHFAVKHVDWADEQEFRFLFRSHSEQPFVIPVQDSLIGIVLGEKNDPNLRGEIYEASELGFVNMLIEKMQADLRRDFSNFSDLDIYHFPDNSAYPLQLKKLVRNE